MITRLSYGMSPINREEFTIMKWIRMLTLIFSVLMMGFFRCGNDNPASSGTITLTIINDLGSYTIHYVYMCLHRDQIHGEVTDWEQEKFSILGKAEHWNSQEELPI